MSDDPYAAYRGESASHEDIFGTPLDPKFLRADSSDAEYSTLVAAEVKRVWAEMRARDLGPPTHPHARVRIVEDRETRMGAAAWQDLP